MTEELKQAAQQVLESLEEIALAGMSGTPDDTEESLRSRHARRAWEFIGIAARAIEPLRTALQSALSQQPKQAAQVPAGFVLVPVEPTLKMQSAALPFVMRQHQTRDVYAAMLAAK